MQRAATTRRESPAQCSHSLLCRSRASHWSARWTRPRRRSYGASHLWTPAAPISAPAASRDAASRTGAGTGCWCARVEEAARSNSAPHAGCRKGLDARATHDDVKRIGCHPSHGARGCARSGHEMDWEPLSTLRAAMAHDDRFDGIKETEVEGGVDPFSAHVHVVPSK